MLESTPLQVGRKVGGGRFTLVKPLGRGGMGEVWLAQDERLNETVALKFLPPEIRGDAAALDDLRRETARSHKLSHPNIVRIHDLHEDADGTAFIVMEYIDGPTLVALRLEQPARVLAWDYLRPLVAQLCAALDYAHGEKVIHRDLKPANIMVDSRGRLKLADFGIAAVASDSLSRVSVKHSTSGTLPYMSPQQVTGKRPQTTDDLYALGATLYELLTGKPPFHSGDITHQVLHEPPEPMDERLAAAGLQNDVPPDAASLIMACLAKEPGQRPQSARLVAEWIGLEAVAKPSQESLAAAFFPQTPASPAAAVAGRPEGNVRSRPAVWGRNLAAAGVVVVVMAGAFWLWKDILRRGSSDIPVAAQMPAQTPDVAAEQPPSMETPAISAAPAPSTVTSPAPSAATEPHPPRPEIAPKPAASHEPDWISPQVPKPGADGWIVLFDGKRLYGCSPRAANIDSGKVSVQDGCLRLDSIGVTFNLIGRDVVIRARLKKVSGQNCTLGARNDGKGRDGAGWFNGGNFFGIGHHVGGPWKDFTSVHTRENYNGFFEMEYRAEGINLTLKADSQIVCAGRDDSVIEGAIGVGAYRGASLFQRIEAQLLDKRPSAATTATTAAPGLVLYFSFDQPPKNGLVLDQSGQHNDGQAVGVKWVADGHRGGGAEFGPGESRVRVPNNASLNPPQFTLAAWIKTSRKDGIWRKIFDKGTWNTAVGQDGYSLGMGGDYNGKSAQGQVCVGVFHGSAGSKRQVTDGEWHHVAGAFDGSTLQVYVDGAATGQDHVNSRTGSQLL